MKVTIITIAYNNLNGLKRTIPSVLSQTYTDYEYIVIDGGSSDGSKEFLQQHPRIDYWVSEPDSGIYNAMNKGIKAAHGEYCIFLNSGDTFFSSQVLENIVDKLQGADLYTGVLAVVDRARIYSILPPLELTLEHMIKNTLSHPSTFCKTTWLKANPYNEEYRIVADWELFFRAFLSGCSYQALPDDVISIFYCDGVSTKRTEQLKAEREIALQRLLANIPDEELEQFYIQQSEKETSEELLRRKIENAMRKPPIKRDLKIMRNAAKAFFKDLLS